MCQKADGGGRIAINPDESSGFYHVGLILVESDRLPWIVFEQIGDVNGYIGSKDLSPDSSCA